MKNLSGKKDRDRREFLALSPLERIRRMNRVFMDLLSLKAKTTGRTEYEIYRRYVKFPQNDP